MTKIACRLVMLETADTAKRGEMQLCLKDNKLHYVSHLLKCGGVLKRQHLYVLSDNEIKEGDWYYNPNPHTIGKHINKSSKEGNSFMKKHNMNHCKKIIATTDESLLYNAAEIGNKGSHSILSHCYNMQPLPQIPKSFIRKYVEEYNKGNIINEVMVDYELNGCCGAINTSCFERNHCSETVKPLVDKNNTIIITMYVKQSDVTRIEHGLTMEDAALQLFNSCESIYEGFYKHNEAPYDERREAIVKWAMNLMRWNFDEQVKNSAELMKKYIPRILSDCPEEDKIWITLKSFGNEYASNVDKAQQSETEVEKLQDALKYSSDIIKRLLASQPVKNIDETLAYNESLLKK